MGTAIVGSAEKQSTSCKTKRRRLEWREDLLAVGGKRERLGNKKFGEPSKRLLGAYKVGEVPGIRDQEARLNHEGERRTLGSKAYAFPVPLFLKEKGLGYLAPSESSGTNRELRGPSMKAGFFPLEALDGGS